MTDLHDTDDDFGARTVRRPLNASDRFESKAAKFYADTLVMAPGKDSATNDHTYEERLLAWDVWCGQQARIAELEAQLAELREAAQDNVDADIDCWAAGSDIEHYKAMARKEAAHDRMAALLQESSDE